MTERVAHGKSIVNQYSAYSAAAGLIPVPVVDIAAVTALDLKMIRELSKVYDIPFKHDRGKAIVASLTGGIGAGNLGYGGRLLRVVPFVGPILALVSGPVFSYAATYAVGRVFLQHFESGGTFLDFDLEQAHPQFQEHFDQAKANPAAATA